jgi:hypothetical protein
MVESSAHEHVAAVSPEKLSRREQVNAFVNPPRLVGASNFTSTLLPSLLNVADSSCGTAGVARSLSTVKVPSAIGPAGYSAALAPDAVTWTAYLPGVAPIRVTNAAVLVEVLPKSTLVGENITSPTAWVSLSIAVNVSVTDDEGSAPIPAATAFCAAEPVVTLVAENAAVISLQQAVLTAADRVKTCSMVITAPAADSVAQYTM